MPDGEIVASSARFRVDVELGDTRSVIVDRGHLELRRRGAAALSMQAGDHWPREQDLRADAVMPEATASGASKIEPPSRKPVAEGHVASASSSAPNTDAPTRAAGESFGQAVGSFVAGRYARADRELEDFARAFPGDSRCEEASFLRAVAQWRLGDAPAARLLARRYIELYPNGLRRPNAERMLESAMP
jgi:TolA-binding protein